MDNPLRILILEDNSADAEIVQFELEEAGMAFAARVVMTEADFIRELQMFSPDLILSDYDLPRYTGVRALTEAKNRCPDIPFILVTGAVTEDRAIDILTQGAKDYVLKDRLGQRLVPAVRRALAEAGEHRARKQAEAELREAHKELEGKVQERTKALAAEIEERKKIEEALRESERRERERAMELEALLDAAPTPIFIAQDTDCLHLTGNRAADDLLRTPRGSETSLSAPAGVRPRHFTAVKDGRELSNEELFAQRAARGIPVRDFEFSLVFDDGTIRDVLGYGAPLHDEKGRPRGAVHVLVDITDRKRAEESLRQSEERQRLVLQSSSMGTFEVDLVTGEGQWNATEFELLGLKPGDVLASPNTFFRFVHPDDVEGLRYQWEEATRTGKLDTEFRIVRADGREHWLAGKGQFIFQDKPEEKDEGTGRRPLRFMGVNFDITERKKAEEEAHKSFAAIKEEKERLRALINSIQDEVWFADLRKRFTLANPAALKEFHLGSDDSVNIEKLADSLEVYRPDGRMRPVEEAPPLRALRGEVVRNQEEIIRTPATDELRYRQVSSSPVRDADGRIVGSVSVVRDITDHKRMEKAVQKAKEDSEWLAGLPEENPDPVIRVSNDGLILYRNPVAAKILAGTEIGKPLADPLRALLEKAMTDGQKVQQDVELGGKYFSVSVMPFARGGYASIYSRDVTERKQAEEEMRKSEALFRAIGELNAFGVWETDPDGGAVYFSQSWLDMVGMSLDQCRQFGWMERYAPGEGDKMLDAWRRCREAGTYWNYEHRIRDKDGIYRTVLSRGFPLRNACGQITKWVGLNIDITERKRAEEQLSKRAMQLEAANKELDGKKSE